MKMYLKRQLAMTLAAVLFVSLFWNLNIAKASAATATPTFAKTKVELVGIGETYQMEIKNKVAKSTYKWTSTNTKIATVTSKGLITSKDKGSATVKCVITYPSKKTKTLSCKVTVVIPSTEISISNATLVNGAHVMSLGSSMDFDTRVLPTNSSDKVYWSIGGGDPACIRIDDAEQGKVTAIKTGKVILKATTAKTSTKEAAAKSIINDAVIIEVVGATATVKSADIVASNEIKVVFDSPVNPNTVIGLNNKLSNNIELTMSKDIKGVLAADPGELIAKLSTDQRTLTITSKNALVGYYGINFSSSILTADGVALEPYYKKMSYSDTTPPEFSGSTLDDTGMVVSINFTEAMDFTNLKISDAKLVSTNGATASPTTIATLNNVLNYTVSTDKKSLVINLSKIPTIDHGKLFSVVISGVKDLAGNLPANVYIPVYFQTDNTPKPQARVISVIRSSYNTLTAIFDRAIQTAGYAQIEGSATIPGVIDINNNKKVVYTFGDREAAYTGMKKVYLSNWNSYNVISSDMTASKQNEFYVNFTSDKTSPVLVASSYDPDKAILTLTYNEEVIMAVSTGIFSSIYTSPSEDVKPNTNITYTKLTHNEGNHIIKLQLTGLSLIGRYSFTIEQGFVTDNFRNPSIIRAMDISTTSGTNAELPGPVSITQTANNLSEVNLRFLYKLDTASAINVSNYKIAGVNILSATLKENATTGATVVLTVSDIDYEIERPMTIIGVKGYNNSYSEITSYSTTITLKENKKPVYLDPPVFETSSKNIIRLNFSEAIQGTMAVKVYQMIGSSSLELSNSVTVNGNSAFISLTGGAPTPNYWIRIDVVSSTITDLNGNPAAPMSSSLMVLPNY